MNDKFMLFVFKSDIYPLILLIISYYHTLLT